MDTYSKVILTTIAGALIILVFQNAGNAKAGTDNIQKVQICNYDTLHDLNCAAADQDVNALRVRVIETHTPQ